MNSKTMRPMTHGKEEDAFAPAAVRQEDGGMYENGEMLYESDAQELQGARNRMPRGKGYEQEIPALLERNPELRVRINRGEEIPREVLETCAKTGVSLRTAYAEYELKQAKAEIEQLRKENKILRQNAETAAKAPVRGASAGGSENKGRDPFLEGLLSDD